jgi:hypothetical protein
MVEATFAVIGGLLALLFVVVGVEIMGNMYKIAYEKYGIIGVILLTVSVTLGPIPYLLYATVFHITEPIRH